MESVGETCCEPPGCTGPIGSIRTSVAFDVRHVSVVDCPRMMVAGLADRLAVGAGGLEQTVVEGADSVNKADAALAQHG